MATEVTELGLDPFDPETWSLEELKARANAPVEQDPTAQPDQKRNADGTFAPKTVLDAIKQEDAAPPAEAPADPDPDPEEETIYQRRIDLGDGAGVQVFQATSMEELVDKLVQAQEHATRKIREMSAAQPKPVAKKTRTADEEFMLSQEFMSKPSQAFEKLFQDTVGMPIGEFKTNVDAVKAFNNTRAADAAAEKFVAITPDYFANQSNGKKIQSFLKTYSLPATVENLTKAYTELNTDGLLAAKPAVKEVTQDTPIPEVQPTVIKPKPKSSGLSSRGGVATRPLAQQGPTEAELYQMPLAQLKQLANSQATTPKDIHDF